MKVSKKFSHEEVQGYRFGNISSLKPKMYSHVYFIDRMLIDTGQRNMRKTILNNVSHLSVNQIFITHHHEDHTGNLADFQKIFNCPSFSSASCAKIMEKPPMISFAQRIFWGNYKPNFNLVPIEGFIETENYKFEIIPLPGHSNDMVGLFEKNKGWFFSADLYIHEFISYFKRDENIAEQIDSTKKALKLDFDILFCSHNPQLKNGKSKLKQKLIFLEDFYGKVTDLNAKGISVAQILEELKLRKNHWIRLLSFGELSTQNMVNSVINNTIV